MQIHTYELLSGARAAHGLTVIIDVFRAFSMECYIFEKGARLIYPMSTLEGAFALRAELKDAVLCGERNGARVAGFDFGNSPWQIRNAELGGQTVIHTTSAGVQGLIAATGADTIITGSLVNAAAIAAYIRQQEPADVSLVAMGENGLRRTREDLLCAQYIKSLIKGTPYSMDAYIKALRESNGRKFFDPDRQHIFPKEDFDLCTDVDRFNFVIQAATDIDGRMFLYRVDVDI